MSTPRRVLLILDDCGAGDALKVSWLIRRVREALPEARLTLLVSEAAHPVYEQSGVVDRLVVSRLYQRREGSLAWLRVVKALEMVRVAVLVGREHDLAITFWWGSSILRQIAGWAARRRVGYGPGEFDFRGDDVKQNARLLRDAGIDTSGPHAPELRPAPADEAHVDRLLQGLDVQRLVALHPGSDWACQMWRPERWAELADAFIQRGAQVVFTGVAEEAGYIDDIRSRMHGRSESVAGKTTVPQLAALLGRSSLCVCVDSGAYVVAQAVGARTVVLRGPTWPERMAGRRLPVIAGKSDDLTREAIEACKEPRYAAGGCLEFACPLAGLPTLSVAEVLAAVDAQGIAGTSAQAGAGWTALPG